jgi:hypothetical protein
VAARRVHAKQALSKAKLFRIWAKTAFHYLVWGLAEHHHHLIVRESRLATPEAGGRFEGFDRVAPKGVVVD